MLAHPQIQVWAFIRTPASSSDDDDNNNTNNVLKKRGEEEDEMKDRRRGRWFWKGQEEKEPGSITKHSPCSWGYVSHRVARTLLLGQAVLSACNTDVIAPNR
jgi:hypothetical protein